VRKKNIVYIFFTMQLKMQDLFIWSKYQKQVMVTPTGFLFRGIGALLQQEIHTSEYWLPFAQDAVWSAPKFP